MEKCSRVLVTAMLLVGVTACNEPKSPDAVANDVSTAQAKSAANIADAQQKAAQDTSSPPTAAAATNADAKAVYDVGTTKAEGDHKVALAKCEALAGNQQKACIDAADADYKAVKDRAKANLESAQSH